MDIMEEVGITEYELERYAEKLHTHIFNQQKFVQRLLDVVKYDSIHHDESKVSNPEFTFYAKLDKALTPVKYGSEEYREITSDPHVNMHKENNSHHPEYYENGIDGMTLSDIINMLADWKSASMTSDTPFIEGMKMNKERFNISDQLWNILVNTVEQLGW